MKSKSTIVLTTCLLLTISNTARGQDANLSFTCDLDGVPAQMSMTVEYLNSHEISSTPSGDISGVFPIGVTVYIAGQVISETARYNFQGENQFADFSAMDWHERFVVKWILDAPKNGVWIGVNPFGDTTYHFCTFDGLVE